MVRLNRDRWYASSGQQRIRRQATKKSNPGRRLSSLIVLLTLVIILMQFASDPGIYSNAFRQLGVPLESAEAFDDVTENDPPQSTGPRGENVSAVTEAHLSGGGEQSADTQDAESKMTLLRHRDQWQAILREFLKSADSESVAALAANFDRLLYQSELQSLRSESNGTAPYDSPLRDLIESQFQSWRQFTLPDDPDLSLLNGDQQRVLEVIGATTLSGREWTLSDVAEFTAAEVALDRTLAEQVNDNEPWKASDRLPLYRSLQRSLHHVSRLDTQVVQAEPIAFQEQPNEYRGRWVEIRGELRRVDSSQQVEFSELGRITYESIWIRSEGTGSQPVNVLRPVAWHAPRPPLGARGNEQDGDAKNQETASEEDTRPGTNESTASLASSSPLTLLWSASPIDERFALGESVSLRAFFLKRLTYRSERGIDVAPVLIASPQLQSGNQIAVGNASSLANSMLYRSIDRPSVQWQVPVDPMANINLLRDVAAPFIERLMNSPILSASERSVASGRDSSWLAILQLLDRMTRLQGVEQRANAEWDRAAVQSVSTLNTVIDSSFETEATNANGSLSKKQLIAKTVEIIPLTEAEQSWFGCPSIFRVRAEPANGSDQVMTTNQVTRTESGGEVGNELKASESVSSIRPSIDVFCKTVPSSWIANLSEERSQQALDTPFVAFGFVADEAPAPFMICSRAQWFGTESQFASHAIPDVPQRLRALAAFEWDLSWLDHLEQSNGGSLRADDMYPFFKLLNNANAIRAIKADAARTFKPSSNTTDEDLRTAQVERFAQMLQMPERNHLGTFQFSMKATRIAKVSVSQQRADVLGQDAYYVIDGLAKLPNVEISLKPPVTHFDESVSDGSNHKQTLENSSNAKVAHLFQDEFPVTVATKQLPNWLQGNDERLIWYPNAALNVDAIFYRLWSFENQLTRRSSKQLKQVGPLMIATGITPGRYVDLQVSQRGLAIWKRFVAIAIAVGCLPAILVFWNASKKKSGRRLRPFRYSAGTKSNDRSSNDSRD